MHISALTVCVDYAPILTQSLSAWLDGLDDLLVVTTARDHETHDLCVAYGIKWFNTDAFYLDGAKFNKGRAMAEAFESYYRKKPLDWFLFFDADISPGLSWRREVEHSRLLSKDCIHGCWREDEHGRRISDGEIAGFFHLAHSSDPRMQIKPIVDTHWYHAGNYDSTFQNRWPQAQRVRLPLIVKHIGEPGRNWCGVGGEAGVTELHRERRRRRGWTHEVVPGGPQNGDSVPGRSQ